MMTTRALHRTGFPAGRASQRTGVLAATLRFRRAPIRTGGFFRRGDFVREASIPLSSRQTPPQSFAHPLFRQIVADEYQDAFALFRRPP